MNLPDILLNPVVKERIREALAEDLGPESIDVTSDALVPEDRPATAHLVGRQAGVLPDAVVPVALRDVIAVGIRPDGLPRLGVHCVNEHTFGWPQACGKVDHAIGQDGTTTGRPQRD